MVKEMNVIEASKREQASRRKQLPPVTARVGVSHPFRGSRDGERRTSSIYYSAQGAGESRRETPVEVAPSQESQRVASVGVSAEVSRVSTMVNGVNGNGVSMNGVNGTGVSMTGISMNGPMNGVSINTSTGIPSSSTPIHTPSTPLTTTPVTNTYTPVTITNTPVTTTYTPTTIDSLHATVIEQDAPLEESDPEEDYEEYDEEQRKSCTVV